MNMITDFFYKIYPRIKTHKQKYPSAFYETELRSHLRNPKRSHLFFYFPVDHYSWSLDNVSVSWIKKEMQI